LSGLLITVTFKCDSEETMLISNIGLKIKSHHMITSNHVITRSRDQMASRDQMTSRDRKIIRLE